MKLRYGGEHCPSQSDQRGASVVEFALMATFLVVLLLGTLSFGRSTGQKSAMSAAAREAARYGATLPVDGDLAGWLENVADIAKASAGDDLASTVPGQTLCIAYVFPNGNNTNDSTMSLTESAGARTVNPGGTCLVDGRPDNERRIQIAVGRQTTVQTGIFAADLNLGASSIMRIEKA